MALSLMVQDTTTLEQAYLERKSEYDILRSAGKWSGAILQAGFLVELMFKRVICKNMGVSKLPKVFQLHDLEFLLYCSGRQAEFDSNVELHKNFMLIHSKWSLDLRYEGATRTQAEADSIDNALFDTNNGVITKVQIYV